VVLELIKETCNKNKKMHYHKEKTIVGVIKRETVPQSSNLLRKI